MSIRPRVWLPTYSDEDDLFAVYSSPFVYELEDFCGRVVDVGGGLLSVEVGLCGEGGRSGCHWSGGVGREGGLCDMEKRFVRVVEQVTNGRAAVADGESRMGRGACHHRSAGGSDGGTHREGLRDQRKNLRFLRHAIRRRPAHPATMPIVLLLLQSAAMFAASFLVGILPLSFKSATSGKPPPQSARPSLTHRQRQDPQGHIRHGDGPPGGGGPHNHHTRVRTVHSTAFCS